MNMPTSVTTEEFTLKLSGSEVAIAVKAATHAIEDLQHARDQFQEVHDKVVVQYASQLARVK